MPALAAALPAVVDAAAATALSRARSCCTAPIAFVAAAEVAQAVSGAAKAATTAACWLPQLCPQQRLHPSRFSKLKLQLADMQLRQQLLAAPQGRGSILQRCQRGACCGMLAAGRRLYERSASAKAEPVVAALLPPQLVSP